MQPLVSVVTVTYNHGPYIARTIESVMAQRVNFCFEYIIAEDCSTDSTPDICRRYAERYPDIIRIVTSEHNVGDAANEKRAFAAARGKYIAICEGDDYWSDPDKLQRQVDFLESNPDYSVCFHRYRKYFESQNRFEDDGLSWLFPDAGDTGVEITMHQFMHRWVTQLVTMVFRRECFDVSLIDRYRYYRDTHLTYHLMCSGRCRMFPFTGAVYNITGSGIYSSLSELQQQKKVLAVDTELWKVNGDRRWREMCAIVMQHLIDRFGPQFDRRKEPLLYVWRIFLATGNVPVALKNLVKVLKTGKQISTE